MPTQLCDELLRGSLFCSCKFSQKPSKLEKVFIRKGESWPEEINKRLRFHALCQTILKLLATTGKTFPYLADNAYPESDSLSKMILRDSLSHCPEQLAAQCWSCE